MSNTSFHFRHTFLLPTRSSQSNVTSCLCLMSHHRVNNKCNRIKGRRWRWLFYALRNFLLRNNMFRVFKSNRHCSWKFRKFHRKTPVLESPQNYEIIWRRSVVKYNRSIVILRRTLRGFLENDFWKRRWKIFISQQTYLYIRVTYILKFYEVSFCTYCKGLFCL